MEVTSAPGEAQYAKCGHSEKEQCFKINVDLQFVREISRDFW